MDKFMNGNIRFERDIQAPDGIHDGIEKNEYYDTNLVALALIGGSLVVVAVGIVGMLLILWN